MFYQRLRDLKEDAEQKQATIAKIINVSENQYGRYERGETDLPLEKAVKLAKFYKVSIDYIAGLTNDKRGLTRSELSDMETDVIKKMRSLSGERRGMLLERLAVLYSEQEDEDAKVKDII